MRFSQLLKHVTPHRNILVAVVGLLLATSAISLAFPLLAGKFTGVLLDDPQAASWSVQSLLMLWLALMVLRAVLNVATSYLVGGTGAAMSAGLRSRVYEHMQILPLSYFQARKQGDILSLLSNDAELISQFVTGTVVQLLPLLLTFFAAFVLMAWIDPPIALLAALLMPLYFIAMKLLGRRLRPLSSRWIESRAGMVALVNENLGLMPVIKGFAREPLESDRFERHNRQLLDLTRSQIWATSLLGPTVGLLAGAGALLLLWVAAGHLESGRLSPAELVSLLMYVLLLSRPLSGLANVYGQVMHTRGAADRLLEFFAERPEPVGQGNVRLDDVAGHITYENITFAYPGREPMFERFSLAVEPGETLALTGPNGAGKSTLVHLLMRFIEPAEGRILIDGRDVADAELASLRARIGLVAQNTLLLNGTVAENICYGMPGATAERMREAASAARAAEFIAELPAGYDTLIGDQGVRLSGGQRQRLSLARTLLMDPPILVLDEATSMFDPEGEAGFIEECRNVLENRTVILITHRPASLALADRIVQLPIEGVG